MATKTHDPDYSPWKQNNIFRNKYERNQNFS